MLQAALVYAAIATLVFLGAVALAAVVFALKRGGRREDSGEDREGLASSRFTIPVSVIVPLTSDGSAGDPGAREFFAALLALHYPELEVIVVVDEHHASLEALKSEWDLAAHEFFYRKSLETADVRRIYRSNRQSRLLVIEKQAAGRADAVNCGVNLARYRYITSVDPDIRFDAGALLRAMAAPLRDPAAAVGATSLVERRGNGSALQLAAIRSLMLSRMALTHGMAAPVAHDAITVWRRDAVLQLGGFSATAADADFDMAIRVQTSPSLSGGVVQTSEIFGHISTRPRQDVRYVAARRQRAALQAVGHLLTAGASGRRGLAAVLGSAIVIPLAQLWTVVASVAAASAGWLAWRDAALVVILLSLGRGIVSSGALLMRGAAAAAPDGASLTRLLLFAPIECVVTGPAAMIGRATGAWFFAKRP
jgi:cellulose synthase/poly-beta-1,6-N-acetylglucosamine synthase-like glycosyltransferase